MKKLLLISLFTSFAVFCQDISANLLLHYTFDNTLLDASDNHYDATNFGASFTDDRFGNPNAALLFDGIDDYIDLPNIIKLKPDLPLSFSFWIRYDSEDANDRDVFTTSFEEDVNSGVYFNHQQSTGNFAINYGDGSSNYISSTRSTYVSNQPINLGEWQHIAVIVTAQDDMKIYVDCVEFGGTYSGSGGNLEYSDTSGSIGRHDRDLGLSANYFKGAMDSFRYWNKALTEEEITILCNETLSVDEVTVTSKATVLYPNPTDGTINFQTSNNIIIDTVILYNSIGQTVLKSTYQSSLNISALPKGIYYLQLINQNNSIETKKVILK
ncbi:LamG-like jellyroll fold domain-containing protein [Aquimarina sp. M1]